MAYCAFGSGFTSVRVRRRVRPPDCSSSSPELGIFFSNVLSLSIVRASLSSSWIRYVGRRFRNLPSEGTKREFWTLVRVDRVDTSGSVTC